MNYRYLSLWLLGSLLACTLHAQTSWKGTASTSWSTAANWTAGVPTASVDAIIGDASFTGTYQPTVGKSSACKSLTIGGTKASTLTLSRSLTISGNLLLNSNGTISQKGTTLTVKGNWTNNGTYSFTSTSALVTFGGTAQSIGGANTTAFRKLTINTGSTTTLTRNISVASTFTVSGTFTPAENATPNVVSGAGAITVGASGVLQVNAATFATNYANTGTTTLSAGSTVDYSAISTAQSVRENLTYSSLRISGGSTKTLAGNLNLLNSTTAATGNLIISAGTLDMAGFTANRGTTVAGGALTIANGASLRIGTANVFPTGFTTVTLNPSSTVEYYAGGTQTVAAQTYGNLSLSSATGATVKLLPATAFTIAGTFTSALGSGTADSCVARADITFNGPVNIGTGTVFNGAGFTHRVLGNWTNNGRYVCRTDTTSTVLINGSGAVLGGTGTNNFFNLTLAASNITGAANLNLNVAGNLLTTGAGAFVQTEPGTLTMSGTGRTIATSGSGTGYVFDNLNITGSISTALGMQLKGNLSVSGSLSQSAGVFTMSGTGKTISGAGTIGFYTLAVPGSVTAGSSFSIGKTLDVSGGSAPSLTATAGAVTFTGSSTLNGTANLNKVVLNGTQLQLATEAVMGIADTFRITAGTVDVSSFAPNTIRFNGTVGQPVNAITYHHLSLTGTGAKTAGGAMTVNGDFNLASGTTFNAGASTHTVKGNWNNAGTFNAGTGAIALSGGENATLTGATTFNTLTVSKTAASNVVTLANDINVPTLNMVLGNINTGSNTVNITSTRTGNGLITGNVKRTHAFVTATPYAFEGPNTTVQFTNPSGITSVTVSMQKGSVTDFPFGGSINRTYTIAVPAGTYTNGSLKFHYEDDELNGNNESTIQAWSNTGSGWVARGKNSVDITSNFVARDTAASITGRWTLSDDANVARWTGSTSSDWSVAANWTAVQGSPSLPPSVSDIAQLGTVSFTNQPVISTAATAKSIQFGDAMAVNLSLTTGGTLNISGNISGSWTNNATHSISTNGRRLTVGGDIVLSDGTNGHIINLNLGGDTASVAGSLTATNGASITSTGTTVLNIGGNFTFTSPGIFTAGSGTVRLNGSNAQLLPAVTYNNLSIAKPSGIASVNSAVTVNGNLNVAAGELDINAPTVVAGSVNIASGAILNGDGVTTSVGGNWNNSGSFISLSGTINFNGSAAQTASATTFNNIQVNKPAGTALSLTGNVMANGNISVNSGTLNLATFTGNRSTFGGMFTLADTSAAQLQVGGANNFPASFGTYSIGTRSTVTYNGSVAQNVAGVTYGNLTISGSAQDSLTGTATINGDLSITGGANFNAGGNTLALYGNWINNGTFNPSTGTVTLQGINKTITGNTTFNRTAVYGSYTVNGADLHFIGALRILSGGSFNAGTGVATLDGDLFNSGSLTSNGVTRFTGLVVQNISFLGALISNSAGEIYFDGTVAPKLISNSTPTYAKLYINNTAGVTASVGWNVGTLMQIASGSSFNTGTSTVHNIAGSFINNGSVVVDASSTLNFIPTVAQTYQLKGTSFINNGTVIFGGSAPVTVNGVPDVMNNVEIADTAGVTPGAGWNVAGDFIIRNNAVFNAGSYNYTVAGDIESDGVLRGNTSTFTQTGNPVTISGSPATTFYNYVVSGNVNVLSDFNIAHNFTNNNAFYDTLGTVIFTDTAAGIISGTASPFTLTQFNVQKSNNGTVTLAVSPTGVAELNIMSGSLLTGTNTITQLSGSGLLSIDDSASLILGGTNSLPVFTTYELDTLSNVEYRGTTQALATNVPYGNLIISTGTKTTAAALNILNDFQMTGGSFNAGGFTHTLGGDWTMTGGTFTNQGTIVLNSVDTQRIGSTGAFNNLTINKTAGPVILSAANRVSGTLSVTDGTITLGNFDLAIDTNGSITNVNDTNYIIATGTGALVQHVLNGGSKLYPVGNATAYLPATVGLTAGSTRDNISVRVMSGVYRNGTSGSTFTTGVVNNTWLITEGVAGGTDATVTLRWPASLELSGFTRNSAKLAHYVGGSWDSGPTLAATGTNPYSLTRSTGITSFSPFIVSGAATPLPLTWLRLEGNCVQGRQQLEWEVGDEQDNDYFSVEWSANGRDFREAGRVSSYRSAGGHVYRFVHDAAAVGVNYYRIRQVDVNGSYSYSTTVAIQPCGDDQGYVRLMQNPVVGKAALMVRSLQPVDATVTILDLQGRVVMQRTLAVRAGAARYDIDLSGLSTGQYQLRYNDATGMQLQRAFLLQ